MHGVEQQEEDEGGEDQRDDVEFEPRVQNVTRALLTDLHVLILAAWPTADPFVSFAVHLAAVLFTKLESAAAVLFVTFAEDWVRTAAAHLASVKLEGSIVIASRFVNGFVEIDGSGERF